MSEVVLGLLNKISSLLRGAQTPTAGQEELLEIHNQKDRLHMVLAFLWVMSQKLLTPIPLHDLPKSTQK
jgi:hypothetical protein